VPNVVARRTRTHASASTDPGRSADMVNTMLAVLILGTHVSGIDVSENRDWQRKRPFIGVLGAFPTVNGIGVSAGEGRRT
jgi:hypothetical protein